MAQLARGLIVFESMLIAVLAASPSDKPNLGVLDLVPQGASNELAGTITGVAVNELDRLGVFRVVSSDTIRAVLGYERQRQLLGCENNCATSNIAELTGYDYLVTGKVARASGAKNAPPSFTVLLTLIDVHSSRPVNSQKIQASSEAQLVQEISPGIVKLVAPVLAGRQGSLLLIASEDAAAVKIDDTTVGTTPLDGRLTVASGPHLLQVEKDGYVVWRKEVRVQPDQVVEENARLMPSPDTIAAYEAKASRMRIGAWVATGFAVAGGVAFGVLQSRATSLYGSPDRIGTFQYHRNLLLQGVEVDGDVDHRVEATRLQNSIETFKLISYISLGVAAAAAGAGIYLWIAGDPPGKYLRLKVSAQPSSGKSVMLVPTLGGAALSCTF